MITRPDGRAYKPRKVIACTVVDGYDEICGVMVLGTHDPLRAQLLADDLVACYVDSGEAAADPVTGWWRDGFEAGRRRWIADDVHGRAGVWFREIVEVPLPGHVA